MSPYTPLPQTANPNQNRNDGGNLPDSFQSNPANIDLAVSDENTTDRTYLAPPSNPKQTGEGSLLDPEEFRRLSMSTISSMGYQSRGVSPFPHPTQNSGTVKISPRIWDFWMRNKGLFLVSFSQLFGALMNVTTRLLELEGEGMHPFQVLFARQGLTVILCSIWMWWKSVPGFPFGAREVRMLLVARSISGFFGIYGMYCKCFFQMSLPLYIRALFMVGVPFKTSESSCFSSEVEQAHQMHIPLRLSWLTTRRLIAIPPRRRCRRNNIPRPLSCKLRLLSLPERALPQLSAIRLSHLPPRRRPHRPPNLIPILPRTHQR